MKTSGATSERQRRPTSANRASPFCSALQEGRCGRGQGRPGSAFRRANADSLLSNLRGGYLYLRRRSSKFRSLGFWRRPAGLLWSLCWSCLSVKVGWWPCAFSTAAAWATELERRSREVAEGRVQTTSWPPSPTWKNRLIGFDPHSPLTFSDLGTSSPRPLARSLARALAPLRRVAPSLWLVRSRPQSIVSRTTGL